MRSHVQKKSLAKELHQVKRDGRDWPRLTCSAGWTQTHLHTCLYEISCGKKLLCYRALPCVAVCCSALQCVAVRCSALQCAAVRCSALQCVAVRCSALQCVAVRCSVLQCVAVRWHALQCVAMCTLAHMHICLYEVSRAKRLFCYSALPCVVVCCRVLQCLAVCCSVLKCDTVRYSALQCVAVRCSALQCVAVCTLAHLRICLYEGTRAKELFCKRTTLI